MGRRATLIASEGEDRKQEGKITEETLSSAAETDTQSHINICNSYVSPQCKKCSFDNDGFKIVRCQCFYFYWPASMSYDSQVCKNKQNVLIFLFILSGK